MYLWNLRKVWFFLSLVPYFFLFWCWDSIWSGDFSLNIYDFQLKWDVKSELQRVRLNSDDLYEIIDLFQENWDNTKYKDSLLVAEKFSQWLWVNAFAQDNLDNLINQWLWISNIEKTQLLLKKNQKNVNIVLVEYDIVSWLISELPVLYVSQLFMPVDDNIVLLSFITEDKSSRLAMSKVFKNVE